MLDKCRSAPCAAQFFGYVFLVVAIIGFIPNPIVGAHAIFVTNPAHNILHGVIGLALLAAARLGHSKTTLLVVGMIYVLVAILGYMMMHDKMFGLIKVNMADHYLHLLLGVVVIAAGAYVKEGKKKK
jgi:hypothetical protein